MPLFFKSPVNWNQNPSLLMPTQALQFHLRNDVREMNACAEFHTDEVTPPRFGYEILTGRSAREISFNQSKALLSSD